MESTNEVRNWLKTLILISLAGVFGTAFFAPDVFEPVGYDGAEQFGWLRQGDFARQADATLSDRDNAARIIAFRGDTIVIDYQVQQKAGFAYLHLWRNGAALLPTESVWHDSVGRDGSHRIEVAIDESGLYQLDAGMAEFAGSLDVTWRVN